MSSLKHTWFDKIIILLLSITAILCVTSFKGNICDGQVIEKWIYSGVSFCIGLFIISALSAFCKTDSGFHKIQANVVAVPFLIAGIIVIIHSVLQIIGVIPVKNENDYHVIAGFDNPAGVSSALTVSFSFVLVFIDKCKDKRIKYLLLAGIYCLIIAILGIANSRVGILASSAVMILYLVRIIDDSRTRKTVATLLTVFVIVAVVCMSFAKRGSNSGRALILSVCWDMFKDAPIFGHGIHGFRRLYMVYQANYLNNCTSIVIPLLADNSTHPLNEYVLVAVNYGITGLAILLGGIILTIRHYLKNPNRDSFIGMTILTGIGVLSLFSYPFRYPLTVFGLATAILLIYKDAYNQFSQRFKKWLSLAIAVLCLSGIYPLMRWMHFQKEWSNISNAIGIDNIPQFAIDGYSNLYPNLKRDPFFLYNYAFILYNKGELSAAAQIANESFDMMSNYDTALLLADIAKESTDINSAETYYLLAASMCPSRFIPLYSLFCLYNETGQNDKMKDLGERILSKPVKVSSNEVRMIKIQVRNTLLEKFE